MEKKLSAGSRIATISLLLALVLCISCIPLYHKKAIQGSTLPGRTLEIIALQTKSGEKLTFSKKEPAIVSGSRIYITSSGGDKYHQVPAEKIKAVEHAGNRDVIETTDGTFYVGHVPHAPKPGMHFSGAPCSRTLSLDEVDLVWVRRLNWPLSIGASWALDIGILVAIVAATYHPHPVSGSCPLIYSFDGSEYVLDAEPYGGAICRGLERVEWVSLDGLKPVDGRYKLLMANELDETDRTDELKLVVAEHAPGVTVVPDTTGRMRTFNAPHPPLSAVDGRTGRDILPLISERDQRYWVSRMEGKDPRDERDLKDELVLTFAKPAGARKAKLVANVWNTPWGVDAAKLLLEARGRTLPSWLAEIDAHGPAYWSALSWFVREEMFNLQVRVETPSGWASKTLLQGSGAAVAKDKAYELDLGDVPGDRVRVKLTPASGFWMIDYLAMDFSPDLPVQVTELAPISAVDRSGGDVSKELASADGKYHVLTTKGDRADIIFAVPPQDPTLSRTVFIKVRGYYDVPVDTRLEPDSEIVAKFNAPGESLRYVLMRHPVIAAGPPQSRSGKKWPMAHGTAIAGTDGGTARH